MTNTAKDLYEIKGDPQSGITADVDLTKTALGHPRIRYRDRITTADVYEMGDELFVHMYCPRCANGLRITSKMKSIRFFKNDRNGGDIDIEEFRCTWPDCGLHVVVRGNHMTDK
jgi:hypothetical protein